MLAKNSLNLFIRINRNIMEFKVVLSNVFAIEEIRINRNIMEFKDPYTDTKISIDITELIET